MSGAVALMMRRSTLNHTVACSPTSGSENLSNGVAYSQNVTAVVSNGIGPFTYLWAFNSNNFGFSLANSTSATCTVSHAAGTDIERSYEVQVTVTDTGNGNITAADACPGNVVWGTPP